MSSWHTNLLLVKKPHYAGNPPVTNGFPYKRPIIWCTDILCGVNLKKLVNNHSKHQWSETTSGSIKWRHCIINFWLHIVTLRLPDFCWDNTRRKPKSCRTPIRHGPFTRYVTLRVAHVPGMPGTCSPPRRVSDPGMPWCMPGSLTSGFLWSPWWGKLSRHSRRMHNPKLDVSSTRPKDNSKRRQGVANIRLY